MSIRALSTALLLSLAAVANTAHSKDVDAIQYCGEVRSVILIASEMKYNQKTPQETFAIQQMRELKDVPDSNKKSLINKIYFAPELSNLNPYSAGIFGTEVYTQCIYRRQHPQPVYTPLK